MNVSEKGFTLIKKFEGCKLEAYQCSAKKWTIGFGHTANVKKGDVITQAQAEDFLKEDIKIFEKYVIDNVPHKLNQNQFDALVSFTYNCGVNNLISLTRKRTLEEIGRKIVLYNKSKGKVLLGLERRRKAEQQLFLSIS